MSKFLYLKKNYDVNGLQQLVGTPQSFLLPNSTSTPITMENSQPISNNLQRKPQSRYSLDLFNNGLVCIIYSLIHF